MGGILIIIFLLVITCEVFLFKNILVNYKDCSGYKIVLLILFAVMVVFSAVIALAEGYSFYENTKTLNTANNLSQDMISLLKYEIAMGKRNAVLSAIIGSLSLLLSYLDFFLIKREWIKELNRPKKKWNLDKMK